MTDEKLARLAAIRAANAAKRSAAAVEGTRARLSPRVDPDKLDDLSPALPLPSLVLIMGAAVAGALAATIVLPAWLPGLSASLAATEPKAYWYLSRASGFVAYGLLWLSLVLGVAITSRLAPIWPGGPAALDLHQHASMLGLAFALFHALILLGDPYIGYTPAQILVPFASAGYEPLWVGMGQLGVYLMAIVGLSFYVRRLIGRRLWRAVHFASYAVFALALLHGVLSGTDSATPWASALYWGSGGSILLLSTYRALRAPSGRSRG